MKILRIRLEALPIGSSKGFDKRGDRWRLGRVGDLRDCFVDGWKRGNDLREGTAACGRGISCHARGMGKDASKKAAFDVTKAWKQVAKKLHGMTPKERTQTLVDAGILTRSGAVAAPYRGVIRAKV